jgi:hypothetical protein
MWLETGNDSAIEGYRNPGEDRVLYRPIDGQRVTRVVFPEGMSLEEAFQSAVRLLAYHYASGQGPAWVDSDSDALTKLLKSHFSIKSARPRSWGKDTGADKLPRMSDLVATAMAPFLLAGLLFHLRTNAGRDWQANIMGSGGAAGAGTGTMRPADYIGLTADTTAPAAGDTTLTGEITTGSLTRAQGAFAHTSGTASYTLTKTFTSDQTIVVAKLGIFNASTGGTMAFETLLNSTASMQSGDQLAITETVSL